MSRLRNVDFSQARPPPRSFLERLRGALTLDATVYEEAEHYPEALGQALTVVLLAALARGLGELREATFVSGVIGGLAGWILGVTIIWLIGVVILRNTSDFPELLRTLGFASAPYLLHVLRVLPLGSAEPLLAFAVWGLGLVAWVVAVRQALDVSTAYALGVCLVAAIPNLFVVIAISAPLALMGV